MERYSGKSGRSGSFCQVTCVSQKTRPRRLQHTINVKNFFSYSTFKFDMPGGNCAIPVCTASMPKSDGECNVNWRKNIVDIITKIPMVGASLKKQI